jgi:hypothetical protein
VSGRRAAEILSDRATVPRCDAAQLIHGRELFDTFSRRGQAENGGVAKVVVDCGQCSFEIASQELRALLGCGPNAAAVHRVAGNINARE